MKKFLYGFGVEIYELWWTNVDWYYIMKTENLSMFAGELKDGFWQLEGQLVWYEGNLTQQQKI